MLNQHKVFFETEEIKYIDDDQYKNLVCPALNIVKNKKESKKAYVIYAPTGTGKTTVYTHDIIWRIILESKQKSGAIIITSPDTSITGEIYDTLKRNFSKLFDLLEPYNLHLLPITDNPKELTGRGFEICVCSLQLTTNEQSNGENLSSYESLKDKKILSIISDESHVMIGSPNSESYKKDIGHLGKDYQAKTFNKIRKLDYKYWFMFTGTPTHSMSKPSSKFYQVISDDMRRRHYKMPFFDDDAILYKSGETKKQLTDVIEELSKRIAIALYKSKTCKINNTKDYPCLTDMINNPKLTAMFKCASKNTKNSMTPQEVKLFFDKHMQKLKNKTFTYEETKLKYFIGKCAVLTSSEKTDKNHKVVKMLNNQNDPHIAVATYQIGKTGISIKNLSIQCMLRPIINAGKVNINVIQYISRLTRLKIIWTIVAKELAKIKSQEQLDNVIDFLIVTNRKTLYTHNKGMNNESYNKIKDDVVLTSGAKTYLLGMTQGNTTNTKPKMSSSSQTKRDLTYKQYRKDKCEIPNCTCYDDYVTNKKNKQTMKQKEKIYQKMLQVDHKDGNRENMNINNLITICPNRHAHKTLVNKDYLNRY